MTSSKSKTPANAAVPAKPRTGVPLRPIFSDIEKTAITDLFVQGHLSTLRPGEALHIDGDVDDTRVSVRFELADRDDDEVTRTEAVALLEDHAEADLVDLRAACVEMTAAFLAEWLADGRIPAPHIEFKEYRWEDVQVLFRGETRREKLLAEADRLLREAGFDVDE